jgi:hypothetical protein
MSERMLRAPSGRATLEAAVLTAGAPVVGWWIARGDPFLLHQGFAWLGFVPLLVGLRHGFMLAFGSALALDGALAFAWRGHSLGVDSFPNEMVIALIALAMLAGQFSDVSRRETGRLEAELDRARRQLDEMARAHCLLELSHDRLVERDLGAPNLRDALAAIRELTPGLKSTWESRAPDILAIFETYCMVQAASLHSVPGGGAVIAEPLAVLGRPQAVSPDDPLLRKALTTRQLAYAPTNGRAPGLATSSLLVAVPFLKTPKKGGGVGAVLCVESLPFIAFHEQNLKTMATIAGHLADGIWGQVRGAAVERRHDFELRLDRALRDVRALEVSAVVAALYVQRDSPASDVVPAVLGGSLRAQDVPFVVRDARGNHLVYLLLPRADEGAARALEERIGAILRRELDLPLDRVGAAYAYHVPDHRDTVHGVMRLLAEKARPNDTVQDSSRVG